eukprot:251052-Ditylum_brightwellii.AAC.1
MNAKEVKKALKREWQHSVWLASYLAVLQAENVEGQAEVDIHEEGRINVLMRWLECLQRKKGWILIEFEWDEEIM